MKSVKSIGSEVIKSIRLKEANLIRHIQKNRLICVYVPFCPYVERALARLTLPLLTANLPLLTAEDIIGVQPMTAPIGVVFHATYEMR
jgi:hypothetical protein